MYLLGVIKTRVVLLLVDEDCALWDGADLVDPDCVTVLATLEIENLQPPSVRIRTVDRQ